MSAWGRVAPARVIRENLATADGSASRSASRAGLPADDGQARGVQPFARGSALRRTRRTQPRSSADRGRHFARRRVRHQRDEAFPPRGGGGPAGASKRGKRRIHKKSTFRADCRLSSLAGPRHTSARGSTRSTLLAAGDRTIAQGAARVGNALAFQC